MGMMPMLVLGTVGIAFVVFFCKPKTMPWWKAALLPLITTAAGVTGTLLLFYIENGSFGGYSFFGAVIFIPFLFAPVSLLLKIPYSQLMDLAAPSESIMLAVMKINCFIAGCCGGRVISYTIGGIPVFFPSQIVESVHALLMTAVLIMLIKKPRNDGKIHPYYLLIYGVSRFILSFFRYDREPFVWLLPAGNFWSLCAVAAGVLWLAVLKHVQKKEENNEF